MKCPSCHAIVVSLPLLSTIVSTALAVTAAYTCHFVNFTLESGDYYGRFGLFKYMDEDEDCHTYNWSDSWEYMDNRFNTARGCGFTTPLLGLLCILLFCCAVRSKRACLMWMCTFFLFVAFILQGLTFLVLDSDPCRGKERYFQDTENLDGLECGITWGGKVSAAACVLWLVASITSCVIGRWVKRRRDSEKEAAGGGINETEIMGRDISIRKSGSGGGGGGGVEQALPPAQSGQADQGGRPSWISGTNGAGGVASPGSMRHVTNGKPDVEENYGIN